MRTKKGIVTSAKANKTVVVTVHARKMHPVLGKAYRVSKKFHAHDEENVCKEGDEVLIAEGRPISKLKRWTLQKVVKTAAAEAKAPAKAPKQETPISEEK